MSNAFDGSYIHIPPTPHHCPVPMCGDPIGTVWRCNTCLTYWRYAELWVGFGSEKQWTTDFWRNLTHKNMRGYWNAIAKPKELP